MMSNDPNHSALAQSPKTNESLWQRIKRILLFNWLFSQRDIESGLLFSENRSYDDFQKGVKFWLDTVDGLFAIVKELRINADISRNRDFSIELLGVNTYLFHLDRLIIKLREHIYSFKYRLDQQGSELSFINRIEVMQFCAAIEHAVQTIHQIRRILQHYPIKKLYNEDLINTVHAFELEVSTVSSAIRNLNQIAFQQEIFHQQIGDIEQSIIKSLDIMPQRTDSTMNFNETTNTALLAVEKLQLHALNIKHEQNRIFVEKLIESYDLLKKCYVVSRKQIVNQTLAVYGQNINSIIDELQKSNIDMARINVKLDNIFNCLESLRFSANHPSRCSKILFDKSKIARKMVFNACKVMPHAFEHIQRRAIKRPNIKDRMK